MSVHECEVLGKVHRSLEEVAREINLEQAHALGGERDVPTAERDVRARLAVRVGDERPDPVNLGYYPASNRGAAVGVMGERLNPRFGPRVEVREPELVPLLV